MEMIRNSMLSYRRAWVQDIGKLLEKSQREKSCSEGKIRVNVLGMVIAVKELDNRLYVCIDDSSAVIPVFLPATLKSIRKEKLSLGTVVEIFGYTAIDPVLSVLSLACEGGCILEDPHAEYERHLNLVELYMKNPEQYPRRPECPLDGKNSLACPKEEMKSLRNTESTTSSEDSLSTRIFHLLGKSPKSLLHLLIQFQEKSLKEIEDAISESPDVSIWILEQTSFNFCNAPNSGNTYEYTAEIFCGMQYRRRNPSDYCCPFVIPQQHDPKGHFAFRLLLLESDHLRMNIFVLKAIGGVLVIAGTLAGAAIPILSSRMGKNGRTEGRLKAEAERSLATDLANRFVCGVFFGAGLLHMLAESIEQIRAIPNIPSFASFLPYAIAFAGIALADICHSSVHFSHGSKNTNVDKFDNDSNERTALIRNSKSQRDISIYGSTDVDDRISHSQNQEDEIYQDSNRLLHAEECKLHVGDHNVDKMNNISNIKSADVEFQDPEESESLAIIVVFLLSVHSFVSGIALGSTSVVHDEIAILIAIVAHKWAEAFAISFSLLQARLIPTKMKIWYFVVYSSATPVGLILATVLEAFLTGTTGLWLQIIFSSLSSGSFLYIACLHMNEDFSHSKTPKFLLTCSLSLGFSIMLIVAIWL